MALNLISSIIVFAIQLLVNFLLAPFILRSLGDEAYGLLTLANSLVSYGYILTMVINSVSGRFIAFEYHAGRVLLASKYYSSVLVINMIFSLLICLSSALFIYKIDAIINLSPELKSDAQIAFGLYFANFCLGLFNGIFSALAFVVNKVYLIAFRSALASLVFGALVFGLYYFLEPMISYSAFAALISSIVVFISSLFIVKKLGLKVRFRLRYTRLRLLKALFKSGAFNSFNSLSYSIINGADLLLCNLLLNPAMVGIMAISKSLIMTIESFIAMLSGVFSPKLTELYAKNLKAELIHNLRFALRAQAFICLPPICAFVGLGAEFYTLWLPFKSSSEIAFIYALAMIAAAPALFSACMYPLLSLNIIVNSLRRPAMANLVMALCTFCSQFALLSLTNLGLWAMFVCASVCYMARILLFDIANAARNLELKKSTFFIDFARNLAAFIALLAIILALKSLILFSFSWLLLVLFGALFCLFGYLFLFFVLFNKEQKTLFLELIKAKLLKVKKC